MNDPIDSDWPLPEEPLPAPRAEPPYPRRIQATWPYKAAAVADWTGGNGVLAGVRPGHLLEAYEAGHLDLEALGPAWFRQLLVFEASVPSVNTTP